MQRRTVWAVSGLILVLGCGGDGNGDVTGPPDGGGTIQGQVAGPGGGIPGVRVQVSGGGSAETDDDGEYRITDVEPGSRSVSVAPPAGFQLAPDETATKSANVTAQAAATVNWSLRLADAAPRSVEVGLTATTFNSSDVTVPVGSTITWVNRTAITHTITPDEPAQPGTWEDVTISGEGTEFEHTFGTTGTYDYVCRLHAGMTGVIRVH